MAPDVRHTLLNLEVTPPDGAWKSIASRLDAEFNSEEVKFSERILDTEIAPPAAAWANIVSGMEEAPAPIEHAPAKLVKRPFWRVAAAAAIVILAVAGWYMLSDKTPAVPANQISVVPKPDAEPKTALPQTQDAPPRQDDVVTVEGRPLPRRPVRTTAREEKVAVSPASFSNNLPEVNPELLAADLPHAGLQKIHPVITKEEPNVEAKPIRDDQGNIVLDKELIFTPDNNYIVVTGPNGEQTRISPKFLPMISSLNGSMEGLDYFTFFLNENNIWKLRFDQWRNKMMNNASFIPTATNLLDLLELKEILQEN